MSTVTVKNDGEEVEVPLADIAALNMDDVQADAGGFESTPVGTFTFNVLNAETTTLGDKPFIAFETEIVDCSAVIAEGKTEEDMVGVKHNENIFIGDVGKALAQAKFLMEAAGHSGSGSLKEMLDGFCGTKFTARVKHRKDKNDPDRVYANIDLKTVAPA